MLKVVVKIKCLLSITLFKSVNVLKSGPGLPKENKNK
jgi:hypothetical protein